MKRFKKQIIITSIVLASLWVFIMLLSIFVSAIHSKKEDEIYYTDIEDLVVDWGSKYKTKGDERFAHIFSKKINGKKVYYIKRSYIGRSRNTGIESFSSYNIYIYYAIFTSSKMEGTVHTHPHKNPIFDYSNASGGDTFGLFIPGQRRGFIVFPNGEVCEFYKNGKIKIINPIED